MGDEFTRKPKVRIILFTRSPSNDVLVGSNFIPFNSKIIKNVRFPL
jgi:hypothetical protein